MAYRELLQPGPVVACLWLRDPAPETRTHRVLPDACVDIVWSGGRLVVAGPATGPAISEIPAGAAALGVRFRIGAAGAALGVPAGELLDASIPLEDLWGADAGPIADRMATAPTPAAQLSALADAVAARIARAPGPDPAVRAAAAGTAHAPGVGERQLRRRFNDAVGYGPRTLHRVLRFQRFLALAAGGDGLRAATAAAAGMAPGGLARLALEAGYADQAHLTRECRRLAGLPPAALLASGAGPAGEASVSFKTATPRPASMAA